MTSADERQLMRDMSRRYSVSTVRDIQTGRASGSRGQEIRMNNYTAADYASDYALFVECIDTDAAFVTDRKTFEALPFDRRVELAQAVIDANA